LFYLVAGRLSLAMAGSWLNMRRSKLTGVRRTVGKGVERK
jgi:hypothetical protein